MRLRNFSHRRALALIAVIALPVVAFAIARPAQVLERVGGLSCRAETVCTDDPSRLQEASNLYSGAMEFLASSVAPLQGRPLVVFCSSWQCYSFMWRDGSAAKTVGKYIIVISPRGWAPYFVRHELIHRLQGEKLGVLAMYGKPEWFIEGMAYALSQDPRPHLIEPFESDRAHFQVWYAKVGKEGLWSAQAEP